MIVLILESVSPSLRGEITKWLLEPLAGVFVGKVSGAVRELLWEKVCKESGEGGCTLIQSAANEQGYIIRSWGDPSRVVEQWEGLYLIRRPFTNVKSDNPGEDNNWSEYMHLDIWAKTDRGVTLAPDEGKYHPLFCHMLDTAMVAKCMWENVLLKNIKEKIQRSLGVPTVEEAGTWVAFFAGLHDFGKATPVFAKRWDKGWGRLIQKGLRASQSQEKSGHNILTTVLLETLLLETLQLPDEITYPIAMILGAHHGTFPDSTSLLYGKYATGSGQWQTVQKELFNVFAHALGVTSLSPPWGNLMQANGSLVILAGLTCVADWIASNHDCFSYAGEQVDLEQYPRLSEERARVALEQLGWLYRPPQKMNVKGFREIFDKPPFKLQEQVIALAELLEGPCLVLLEYPMGGGKTEAALWLADYLASTYDQKGIYFALPTMATSNQMFGRVNKYIGARFPDTLINTMLLHGHASLNSEFKVLRQKSQLPLEGINTGEDQNAGLQAAEWFTYRKRGLLSPYGVGTIDQALLAVLQCKHFFVRLFGLAGKVIILDEVHAYDSYMQVLLSHLLSWLAECNTSVILLSATLPDKTRRTLLQAYATGLGLPKPDLNYVKYPRLSWVSARNVGAECIEDTKSREVLLRKVSASDNWMQKMGDVLQEEGCAAIIVNTVGKAQELYEVLKRFFPEEELILFHARFPFDVRAEIEKAVLDKFGPEEKNRPKRSVVVATQVVEQSLDLDFDLMITELAPIDLILQRSGRIWRHQRSRPGSLTGPELWVLMPDLDDLGRPVFDAGSAKVYEPHNLFRSWLVLRERDSLLIPQEVENMVEGVYKECPAPEELPKPLAEMWTQTFNGLKRRRERDENEAMIRYIPGVDSELIYESFSNLTEDEDEKHLAFQALTRLTGPSVTVICLEEKGGNLWTIGMNKRIVSLDRKPDLDDIRDLLGCSLRLSLSYPVIEKIRKLDPPPTWAAQTHLRRCRLLRFDSDGNCLEEDIPLRLDIELGLIIEHERKEGEK
ncbi:MAG: CRISPR-associated helicase Cas3' [Lawsonibacter sp.]|jgi:CRISPR-associated endonuclease/helicase Cas3